MFLLLIMEPLIKPQTRDERQQEAVDKWLKTKGHGTVVGGTGVGFTRIGLFLLFVIFNLEIFSKSL